MDKVRFGVVGLGNMGSHHISYLNQIEGAVLVGQRRVRDDDVRAREAVAVQAAREVDRARIDVAHGEAPRGRAEALDRSIVVVPGSCYFRTST